MAKPTPVLKVTDMTVEFWVDGELHPAAIDMNFEIAPGEVLAIVGESGSGKSTSAMALLGLLPQNARLTGTVELTGKKVPLGDKNALRRIRGGEIAVIFQEPMTALNPVYKIGFQIMEAIRAHSDMGPSEAKERALELIRMVELPEPEQAFHKYPHQLSGGQRQRAMIAQSLSSNPKLLIADEPTTALDVTVQAEILDLMRNLRDKLDSAILLITHDMGVVADLADHIMVMRNGLVVERGDIQTVFSKPSHPYTQELLAAVPRLGEGMEDALLQGQKASSATKVSQPQAPVRSTEEPRLKLENVSIDYPKRGRIPAFRAVEGVSLEVYPGEILGLVGESGSGKTTIGRAAIGLLPVAEGKLWSVGTDISKLSGRELNPIRRKTGIVFQDPASSLNPRMPIGESIGEPMFLAGVARGDELAKRVEDLLDKVELPRSYRNRFPHELSGGQRQRVGIARALALQPELLIADEPTSALDVSVQARFLDLLQSLQDQLRFACLFVSHDLAVVDVLADRIAVMHKGKLVEQGTRDQILRNPQDPYTQRLIAAVPVPDPVLQRERRERRAAKR